MTPHCSIKVLLLAVVALPHNEALFSRPPYSFAPSPFHFHLDDDGPPFLPKYTSVKLFSPSSVSAKFPSWKKPPKYLVGKLPDWKVPDFDDEKNLKEVVLEEPFRPVSFDFNSLPKSNRFDDVKPVTEHIEGDLKYDFRTKTHSI
ncbi:uncharacterized protein LOC123014489 [Tribolium madens]|uniref:uncharacterized protein LOC123014489 n=1 Tax=Tribolium madens TaxID=41895 RepID=UPI001CF745C6|nr:uncharacterized protein LOC123014489 [Tribolium madens]